MEPNKEEALRAKQNAEKRFAEKDYKGAKNYALKAQMLHPVMEGIAQMVATFEVYVASEVKVNGETDFYSILGLQPSAGKAKVKKHYRKMVVLLHPDNNKTVGADGAFKLVSEAWTLLSDNNKRSSYDIRRNRLMPSQVTQTNLSSVHSGGVTVSDNYPQSSFFHHRPDTFWTVCTSCQVQYEYLRKYLNKRLSCKNCRGVFIAVETGLAPASDSFPYSGWSRAPDNGYGCHGLNGVTYVPTNNTYFTGKGLTGFHSGHGSDYVSNLSFQWTSYPGASAGVVDPKGTTSQSAHEFDQTNGNGNISRSVGKHHLKGAAVDSCSSVLNVNGYSEPSTSRVGRPPKRRMVDNGGASRAEDVEMASNNLSEIGRLPNGNGTTRLTNPSETPGKCYSAAPALDGRKLLMDKARAEIRKKLEEMKMAAAAVAAMRENIAKVPHESCIPGVMPKKTNLTLPGRQSQLRRTGATSMTVPDSDFHDFDKDRSEECFKPKQIWAIYDEEDGMPRLYCLIRQVISVRPFKIHISYLNSKTNSEFGSVNWIDSGFTKSCGNFRTWNSDVVDHVNIFSHLLSREKARRGGCVRIYPRSGDIWAIYRNWSCDWSRKTPDEVRHQYEMVEVLDDYSEELGVCISPLVKLDGYKTVYKRNPDKGAIWWVPRREMLRFSHRVPSWLLKGEGTDLPDGCWDLDPAATLDGLLQSEDETKIDPCQAEN